MKQGKRKDGYLQVNLYKNGKVKQYLVHRLVAIAFLPNPMNLPFINHKDENKINNCVENLEWCTHKYNTNYGTTQQRRVSSTDYKAFQEKRVASTDYKAFQEKRVTSTDWKAIAEKLSRQVYQYSLDGTLVAIWQSTQECGRNGYNYCNVSQCCNGKRKSHRGYIWSYYSL